MYHLRRLNLAHNHLSIIKVNMFSGLSYLEELNLAENPIMHIEEESFRNLISLRKLVIEGTVKMVYNKTIETFTREMFKDLKDLQDLTLVGLQLQSLNTDTFTDLYQLRRLNLARNRFTKVPVIHNHDHEDETNFSMDVVSPQTALIFPITIKTKLIYLNLSHNQITCLQPSAFQYLYKLKHLIMNFNRINIITRDAFIGLHSLQILELQGNPLTFIQPYAFIPVKISLKSLFLSDIISEEHGNVIKYLNRTSFALLTTATKIIGLEKWNIFTGCNQTIDIMLSSNKHYTKDIGKDIKCEADVELITKMLIDPKITEVASSSVNAEREHEESELSFTQINDSVIHDNLNESQNIVIIIFGSGMSLIIILLILLMLYRLYAYKLKSKDTKHTSSTYLKSKEKTFCLEKGAQA
ncbi:unnamed protein product [Heterobilharzia americana]|nr:unnamed protein product [Heterobilharzia americana]